MSVRGTSNITACVSGPGLYPRNRARGGLARGTARTTRALPCRPGTVPNATTAATRHLARHSRSFCLHSTLAHLRATRPKLHTIAFTLTTGDAAACSRMATDISRVYSDLTHAVTLTTHGRSLTRASLIHTPAGHSPAVFHTHVGVHTHVPRPARTWFPRAAVPLSHTACREAHTPAHP